MGSHIDHTELRFVFAGRHRLGADFFANQAPGWGFRGALVEEKGNPSVLFTHQEVQLPIPIQIAEGELAVTQGAVEKEHFFPTQYAVKGALPLDPHVIGGLFGLGLGQAQHHETRQDRRQPPCQAGQKAVAHPPSPVGKAGGGARYQKGFHSFTRVMVDEANNRQFIKIQAMWGNTSLAV